MADVTKKDIIDDVIDDTGISRSDAKKVIAAALNSIHGNIARGKSVNLIGFGTFKPITRKARKARNPSTGETIQVEARKALSFKPGKALRDSMA